MEHHSRGQDPEVFVISEMDNHRLLGCVDSQKDSGTAVSLLDGSRESKPLLRGISGCLPGRANCHRHLGLGQAQRCDTIDLVVAEDLASLAAIPLNFLRLL